EHRIAKVVVHDIQGPSHALRNLLDEAEWARILAHPHAVECRVREGDSPELVAFELELVPQQRAVPVHVEDNVRRLRLKLEVESVEQRSTVDTDDPVSWLDPQLHGERCRCDRFVGAWRCRHQIDSSMGKLTDNWHGGSLRGRVRRWRQRDGGYEQLRSPREAPVSDITLPCFRR